ncbi:MAG TPA: hypothetical protein VK735_24710 [Pseudonocardia sp.]|jgi:hypothetical protein|uniref:hypothetical protein n=1 Tax=Pseudonocardia sp. TaxID=60912 RepID=UPI002C0FAA6C|nr:hypothetical protein [Pseudonocardia sp.]HTF50655.1 hypothetical protein [Pseudonocardia sp.]
MTAYIQTVLSRPVPGAEEEFNRWYESTHMPEVLSLPGFVAGQRYAPADPSDPYLAVYDIEANGIDAIHEAVRIGSSSMTISDALDPDSVVVQVFQAQGPRALSPGTSR